MRPIWNEEIESDTVIQLSFEAEKNNNNYTKVNISSFEYSPTHKRIEKVEENNEIRFIHPKISDNHYQNKIIPFWIEKRKLPSSILSVENFKETKLWNKENLQEKKSKYTIREPKENSEYYYQKKIKLDWDKRNRECFNAQDISYKEESVTKELRTDRVALLKVQRNKKEEEIVKSKSSGDDVIFNDEEIYIPEKTDNKKKNITVRINKLLPQKYSEEEEKVIDVLGGLVKDDKKLLKINQITIKNKSPKWRESIEIQKEIKPVKNKEKTLFFANENVPRKTYNTMIDKSLYTPGGSIKRAQDLLRKPKRKKVAFFLREFMEEEEVK